MDGNTVVIDIQARYKDKASSEVKNTTNDINRMNNAIEQTKGKSDKAKMSLDKIASTVTKLGKKVITIPVKILDYATKPLRGLFNFATSIKGILTGMLTGVAVKKGIMDPIGLADAYTSSFTGFETLLKSTSKAQQMMNNIDAFAKATPFKTAGVIEQSQRMLAMGWNPDDIIKDMRTIGDAAAGTGKGEEGLQRIVLALSQIRAKGKLSSEELNQLAESGIGAREYLAEHLGYGKGDVAIAKLSKDIEKGLVGSEAAVGAILKGMKQYEGMMDKTSKTTVKGLKSNIDDTFEINILRKWGQGLQEGAISGMAKVAGWLDTNQEKLGKFGDKAKEFARTMSLNVADSAQKVIEKLMKITNSKAFEKADGFEKIKILWDEMIWNPFMNWWNGEGGAKFKAKAGEIGGHIGGAIAGGMATAFGELLPNMLGSAAKVVPGGEKADAMSYLSAGLLGYGTLKLGNGTTKLFTDKTIGQLAMGKLTGKAAATTGASAAVGTGIAASSAFGVGGAVVGGLGLVSAFNDFKEAAKTANEKEQDVLTKSGVVKGGVIAGGAGLGAAIGSIIPGLGTLVGAGIGAGVGGLVSLFGGDKLGKTWSDWTDGTAKIKDTTKALQDSTSAYQDYYTKAAKTDELVALNRELKGKIDSGKLSTDEMKAAQEQYNGTIDALIGMYPGLISKYDEENGKLEEKLGTLKQIADIQKNQAKIAVSQQVLEFDKSLPDITKKYDEYQEKVNSQTQKAAEYQQKATEAIMQETDMRLAKTLYEEKYGKGSVDALTRINTGDGRYVWRSRSADGKYATNEDTEAYTKAYDKYFEWYRNQGDYVLDNTELSLILDNGKGRNKSDRYTKDAGKYVDSVLEDQKNLESIADELQKGYNAKVQNAVIDSGLDLSKYEGMISKINEYSEKIEQLKKDLNDPNKNKDDINKRIEDAQKEQEKLIAEIDKVKEPLSDVYRKIQDIGIELGTLVGKKVDIEVGLKYFNIPTKNDTLYPSDFIGPLPSGAKRIGGKATGTPSAGRGLYWVGEKGPELVNFNGGERVFNAGASERIAKLNQEATQNRPTGVIQPQISLGGINIQVDGGSDTASIMTAIREQMPEIADSLCEMLAKKLSRIYGNMPLSVEGV